eukprot:COSAG04_NODE_16403_length_500_cov_0.775561_1_plen_106_part_10
MGSLLLPQPFRGLPKLWPANATRKCTGKAVPMSPWTKSLYKILTRIPRAHKVVKRFRVLDLLSCFDSAFDSSIIRGGPCRRTAEGDALTVTKAHVAGREGNVADAA